MSQLRKANYKLACRDDLFAPVRGYEGLYEVNKRGLVRNANTKDNLRPGLGSAGYVTVHLYKNKVGKSFTVHRLVALAFIPNPENKDMVNHMDGIKTNNHLSNLEWATRSENEKHGHRTGLKKPLNPPRGLIRMDMEGNVMETYKSTIEAEGQGYSSGNIAHVCNGKRISHAGFKWAYLNK